MTTIIYELELKRGFSTVGRFKLELDAHEIAGRCDYEIKDLEECDIDNDIEDCNTCVFELEKAINTNTTFRAHVSGSHVVTKKKYKKGKKHE